MTSSRATQARSHNAREAMPANRNAASIRKASKAAAITVACVHPHFSPAPWVAGLDGEWRSCDACGVLPGFHEGVWL